MKVSGFSYIRNGFKYGYPFIQSIQSVLPICDEFVVAVGDSEDGTREAIVGLGNPKIRIIDTIWDEKLKTEGKIFAQQANIALSEISGDWAFHIQADELIHENDIDKVVELIRTVNDDKRVEGLLFDFLNFHGSYDYLNNTRDQHKKEIRVFRNNLNMYSYRDSQGFRKYPSREDFLSGKRGDKLKVVHSHIPVYHYSYVRNPVKMNDKSKYFETFWHDDRYVDQKYQGKQTFDYYDIERVKRFTGHHPALMKGIIEKENWAFDPGMLHKKLSLKDKLIYALEDIIKYRIGEYKNYKLIQ